jgi:hypothetical protein
MASAVILARVRQLAPEFASLADASIAERADAAGPYIGAGTYSVSASTGQKIGNTAVSIYDEAVSLWTCHTLTRIPVAAYDSSGTGGATSLPVTSDTTGPLAQTYGMDGLALTSTDASYRTTRYGAELIRLRSTRARAAVPWVS